jgi:hypothetical protein
VGIIYHHQQWNRADTYDGYYGLRSPTIAHLKLFAILQTSRLEGRIAEVAILDSAETPIISFGPISKIVAYKLGMEATVL